MTILDYIDAIKKRKYFIVAGALVCALLAVVAGWMRSPTYEAEATLMVEESVLPRSETVQGPTPHQMEAFTRTYQSIVKSKTAMQKAISEFSLTEKMPGLNWKKMGRRVTVSPVSGTQLLHVQVELPEPELASRVANYLVEQAIERAKNLRTTGTKSSRELLKEQVTTAREELQKAREELRSFRTKAQLPILKQRMDTVLGRKSSLEAQLPQVKTNIAEMKAKLMGIPWKPGAGLAESADVSDFLLERMKTAGQKEKETRNLLLEFQKSAGLELLQNRLNALLSRRTALQKNLFSSRISINTLEHELQETERLVREESQTITLSRKLAESPLFQQSAARATDQTPLDLAGMSMYVESTNPTYTHLSNKLADMRARRAELKARIDGMEEELGQKEKEIDKLRAKIAPKQMKRERLKAEHRIASRTRQDYLKKGDQVIQLAGSYATLDALQGELQRKTETAKELQEKVVTKETKLERLRREHQLKASAYKNLSSQLDQVSVKIASRAQDLKIVEEALPPQHAAAFPLRFLVLGALVVGGGGCAFVSLVLEYIELERKRLQG